MEISVVIPCYKSSQTIGFVVNEIRSVLGRLKKNDYEIILVNDCSPDEGRTISAIRTLCTEDRRILGIDLAFNSGQSAATMAGLSHASGEYIVVGDDDGQTPFDALEQMFEKLQTENYDAICADYTDRGERSAFRRFGSMVAIRTFRYTMEIPNDLKFSAFFLARKFVIQEILRYHNPYPYVIGLLVQATHNIGSIQLEQGERVSGKSGYTIKKLLSLWLNGFTAFSVKPLRISASVGILCAILGFLTGAVTVIRKLVYPDVLAGYTTTLAVLLFIGGIIMMSLGLIGEYVGRIYLSINNKPQYVIREVVCVDSFSAVKMENNSHENLTSAVINET